MHDVIVAGGGVIGLALARELALQGRSTLVLDGGAPGEPASWAAAGMLAPLSEAESPDPLFQLCTRSHAMYRRWCTSLFEESGVDPEYADPGLLFLAPSEAAFEQLKRRVGWQREAGFAVEILTSEQVREAEPLITLPVHGGVLMPAEHHVTPRRLLNALRSACAARGVEIRAGVRVHEVLCEGNRVAGVRLGTERLAAPVVVIASGVWSSEIDGLRPPVPLRPKKGQILAVAAPRPSFRRIIRWAHAYLVPRRNGDLVVGATNEDVGFDRAVTAGGIGFLLAELQRLSSHTAACPIQEMWAGFRPATPDNLPVLGQGRLDGLFYATGHYRNGILLAPVTAAIMSDLVAGRVPPVPLEPYSPFRFESNVSSELAQHAPR